MYLCPDLAVEEVLSQGLALLLTDDSAWDRLLHDISAEKRVDYRNRFREGEHRTPAVTLGYPRAQGPWPLWAVILAAESPEQDFLGRGSDGPGLYDVEDDGGESGEVQAEAYRMVTKPHVGIIVGTINARETAVHSVIVGRLILASMRSFFEWGFHDVQFVNRGDLAPDPIWIAEGVWARQQTWAFVQQESALATLGDGIALTPPARVAAPDVDFAGGGTGKATPKRL